MKSCTFVKFVIPCWGVRDVVGRMLDSIFSQTFGDYHVVCVDDCSEDGTYDVLLSYASAHSDKMTLVRNRRNIGAAQSRNIGVLDTADSLPSEFLWVVDADDWLAGPEVLQKIYDFVRANPRYDLVNVGWTCGTRYEVARVGWPVGLCGRLIRPEIYVRSPDMNLTCANDVYSHYVMFDAVDDSRIGSLDYNCYVYPKAGKHRNSTAGLRVQQEAKAVGVMLMSHKFRKRRVVDVLNAGTGRWIRKYFPCFSPYLVPGGKD